MPGLRQGHEQLPSVTASLKFSVFITGTCKVSQDFAVFITTLKVVSAGSTCKICKDITTAIKVFSISVGAFKLSNIAAAVFETVKVITAFIVIFKVVATAFKFLGLAASVFRLSNIAAIVFETLKVVGAVFAGLKAAPAALKFFGSAADAFKLYKFTAGAFVILVMVFNFFLGLRAIISSFEFLSFVVYAPRPFTSPCSSCS